MKMYYAVIWLAGFREIRGSRDFYLSHLRQDRHRHQLPPIINSYRTIPILRNLLHGPVFPSLGPFRKHSAKAAATNFPLPVFFATLIPALSLNETVL